MTDIALPPFHVTKTVKHTVEADHRLQQDLERYQAFYQEAYGAKVEAAALIREMARRFMEDDREFQAFRDREAGRAPRKPRSRRRSNAQGPRDGVETPPNQSASTGNGQSEPVEPRRSI